MSARKRQPLAWTEAHRRESIFLILAIGQNASLRGEVALVHKAATWVILGGLGSEAGLRTALSELIETGAISREVRRVDALATGRLVRETVYACRTAAMGRDVNEAVTTEYHARRWLSTRAQGDWIVRVTRIRRATR